jgi:hypothetical protein
VSENPKTEIAVGDKLASKIWRVYGLAQSLEALGGRSKPISTLPGFIMAVALVEKELADERAVMSGEVYRTAARAGHDIGKCSAIYTNIVNGKPVVQIEFADLVDQAEDAS